MATSSPAFPQKKNRYSLFTFLLLFLFCLSLFLFSRRNLEPRLSVYRDLFSGTPDPVLHSLRGSNEIHDLVDKLAQPVSSDSDLDDNNVGKTEKVEEEKTLPISSDKDVRAPVSSGEDVTVPISSKSDLDGEADRKGTETPVPPISQIQEKIAENTTEPISPNEEKGTPISSNEEKVTPIPSESGIDERTRGESTVPDTKETSTRNSSDSQADVGASNAVAKRLRNCDLYKGTWVKDESYPIYAPGSCPYVDEAFDCQSNGRSDSEYLKWRWKPDDCDLPRFNATDFLIRLRGKRLLLVGDSMNRNQFESLLCVLREGLQNKSKMYEVHGYKITKGRGYYIFKFEDYNCTVEFVRSHFLVREGIRINTQGNSNPTLSIDRIDKSAARWKRADILVFNTGHWWAHGKTARGKNYYKEGDYIYPQFDAVEAYRRAIKTWGSWIDRNMKGKMIFYRGYSSAHFRGGDWDSGGSCKGETEPVFSGPILDRYPVKMKIVENVIKKMHVPVVLLNVTRLTNFRKDGHPSIYGKNVTERKKVSRRRQDCSHWCLPGVPDTWNELIYARLVER